MPPRSALLSSASALCVCCLIALPQLKCTAAAAVAPFPTLRSFQPGRRPYFDLFGSETPAEGPSVASGTAAYYSWNWGHVHFVALETNHVNYCNMRARNGGQHGGGGIHRAPPRFDCGPGAEAAGNSGGNGSAAEWARGERVGEMVAWLQRDLSAVSADPRVRWLVAYLHHSPYMRGDHNSDNSGKEPQSAFARAHLLPLLEEAGVDLVLSGADPGVEAGGSKGRWGACAIGNACCGLCYRNAGRNEYAGKLYPPSSFNSSGALPTSAPLILCWSRSFAFVPADVPAGRTVRTGQEAGADGPRPTHTHSSGAVAHLPIGHFPTACFAKKP